ncbi:MAG: PRC-barrel domain-containing protein [Methylibium sp.]|uniref:PRC-barrel domain-containing protein n=1 Tax=Methylibium sp. TaxID=2067992 RepID=UPI0017E88249|nr:PRC-barrel domain-containing protein [Methylibium sp.]MBA2721592.1 PRC-barrel domain-containing protein [Methylibium sp.]MBA3589582.1 PRC-barrel domain-containing protein [Methylibium sp.]
MRASKLIGSDVRNAQDQNLGNIKDLIIDVTNDRVYYAILSFGGFLGLGDKLFAYPVSAFRQVGNEDKVILNIDEERLKKAPGFDSKEYPDFNAPKYRSEVDGYFGPDASVKPMKNQLLRRASDWLGKDINDRNGKDVGEVEDLVVNLGSGKIRYAIVEFDKSWSLNDKLLAVPMQALRYTSASKDLVWDIDKSRLDAKGAFDKNKWPDINDPKTMADIDRTLIVLVPVQSGSAASGAEMQDKKQK